MSDPIRDALHAATQQCQEAVEVLYAYLDAELERSEAEAVRQHLAGCPPCLEEVHLEEIVRALVRRSCTSRAPETLRQRIVHQLTVVRTEGNATP